MNSKLPDSADMDYKYSCYSFFVQALKSLHLEDFPCGKGSWTNKSNKMKDLHFFVTTKDYGAKYEPKEVLLNYLNLDMYSCEDDWSNEIQMLRQLTILNPEKFSDEQKVLHILHKIIKTLMFRDKNINCIDKNMLKFESLEELILSCNYLESISSKNLPKTLQVLELSSNLISDIEELCKYQPPPLIHIGLSQNKMSHSNQYKFFTSNYWPNLVSLDLSHNNLVELVSLVNSLQSLKYLKILSLKGNPLSLTSAYSAHVIDSLPDLQHFDDVVISADDKHAFKGARHHKGDAAVVRVEVGGLCGVPEPTQEAGKREDPVVVEKFFVKYKMVPSCDDGNSFVDNKIAENGNDENDDDEKLANFQTDFEEHNPKIINLKYNKAHTVVDLRSLDKLLVRGITFQLYKQVTKLWPLEDIIDKKTKKDKKDKGKKDVKEPKKKSRSSKKSVELKEQSPPEVVLLGSCFLETNSIATDDVINKICYLGGGPPPPQETWRELFDDKQKEEIEASNPKDRKSKQVKLKQEGKEKKNKKNGKKSIDGGETPEPKPAILMEATVALQRWTNCSIKD